eukprot:TRINITY_DN3297_c0_g1_i2.p1 TRINITY_DN3297_c0_g1~~TRINITY_DN3297_c0_g1_i2.p1  ORF type:complete len:304 (-),score=52.48 TRINITY_DN3297_c0_g1_i2:72-983(-)
MSSTYKTVAFLLPSLARSPFTPHRCGGGRRRYRVGPVSGFKSSFRSALLSRLSVADLPLTPRSFRPVASVSGTSVAVVTMAASSPPKVTLALDEFCVRQFDDPEYAGTRLDWDKADFEARVNAEYEARLAAADGDAGAVLKDGYAPFCKHIFMKNFIPSATLTTLPITPDNEHLLRTKYAARTEKELPVLTRFFPLASVGVVGRPTGWTSSCTAGSRSSRSGRPARGMSQTARRGRRPSPRPWATRPGALLASRRKRWTRSCRCSLSRLCATRSLGRAALGWAIQREAYEESVAYWKDRAVVL